MRSFVAGVYLFLYIPIFVLIIFSFNRGEYATDWVGFTTDWYSAVFASTEVYDVLLNSLIVAMLSIVLSLCMGSLYVFYSHMSGLDRVEPLFYLSLAVPEIILAVGLLSLFSIFALSLGLMILVVGHTLVGLGYVIPVMSARYQELDSRLLEASYDLGATRTQTFFRVVIPFLMPALISSALLVFIVSFDDFVLSFFCSGPTSQTLPVYLFSLIRSGATPMVNVISTLMLCASTLVIGLFSWLQYGRRM